jgi:phospholipid/cholesterol/gamma-HCH transport system permease protein
LPSEPALLSRMSGDRLEVAASGAWTTIHGHALEELVAAVPGEAPGLTVDVAGLRELDTLGAALLDRLLRSYEARGREARLVGLPPKFERLYGEVHRAQGEPVPAEPPRERGPVAAVIEIGHSVVDVGGSLVAIVDMLGALGVALARVVVRPQTFRFTSAIHHLDRVGWQAIPIILLITFLIGGIIEQQGIYQLRQFGAEDFAVDLVGILVLREIGVLIVAIMVAGRSGSSYTAELGTMKMREEMDALRVMSLDPVEVLMLPRVVALILGLPILAFLGSLSALVGGGLVAWSYGGMTPVVFIGRLKEAISLTHFEVGMIKAPFMALIIGVVACAEGLRVQGSAESLGLQTTTSVVKSIFLVIVIDGLFAIFFSSIGM